jgi:hypothetical protein
MATDTKWVIGRLLAALVLIGLLGACGRAGSGTGEIPTPEGPPEIRYEVVRQHALEFDVDLPSRPPGSQLELAAASYILGNLQLGGYSPRLDRVPVADSVSSTNVIAFPPSGADPEFLVTIAYDTPRSGTIQMGRELGLFLELARVLTAVEPEHAVAFVALGAESNDNRGTRRLAQFLLDQEVEPSIIWIRKDDGGMGIWIRGACQGGTEPASDFTTGACADNVSFGYALDDAGFQLTTIAGDIEEMGRALLDFVTRPRS